LETDVSPAHHHHHRKALLRTLGRSTLLLLLLGCSAASPPTAPDAVPLDESGSAPTGPGVTGRWMRTGYAVTGTVTLIIAGESARLDLSQDFTIGQAPGPTLYLNTTGNPNTGRPLRIGALRSNTGAQSYTFRVPASVRYTHVIIWCDPFNVAMAEAVIPATGG
jgi:hypothetical protein